MSRAVHASVADGRRQITEVPHRGRSGLLGLQTTVAAVKMRLRLVGILRRSGLRSCKCKPEHGSSRVCEVADKHPRRLDKPLPKCGRVLQYIEFRSLQSWSGPLCPHPRIYARSDKMLVPPREVLPFT